MAPRSGHQGYAWQRMKSAGTQPVRGEGGSWWTTDTPLKHIPRSLSRYQVKGKQAMKIKLHVRTCKCNKTIEKHLRTRGAPMGEIHGLLLPVARRGQRQSGEARAGRQTFWGPCPLPATGTLPPSLPPSERSKKTARENVPRRAAGGGGGGVGLGRREKFGGAQLSREAGRKKSLLSASCTRGEETDD